MGVEGVGVEGWRRCDAGDGGDGGTKEGRESGGVRRERVEVSPARAPHAGLARAPPPPKVFFPH